MLKKLGGFRRRIQQEAMEKLNLVESAVDETEFAKEVARFESIEGHMRNVFASVNELSNAVKALKSSQLQIAQSFHSFFSKKSRHSQIAKSFLDAQSTIHDALCTKLLDTLQSTVYGSLVQHLQTIAPLKHLMEKRKRRLLDVNSYAAKVQSARRRAQKHHKSGAALDKDEHVVKATRKLEKATVLFTLVDSLLLQSFQCYNHDCEQLLNAQMGKVMQLQVEFFTNGAEQLIPTVSPGVEDLSEINNPKVSLQQYTDLFTRLPRAILSGLQAAEAGASLPMFPPADPDLSRVQRMSKLIDLIQNEALQVVASRSPPNSSSSSSRPLPPLPPRPKRRGANDSARVVGSRVRAPTALVATDAGVPSTIVSTPSGIMQLKTSRPFKHTFEQYHLSFAPPAVNDLLDLSLLEAQSVRSMPSPYPPVGVQARTPTSPWSPPSYGTRPASTTAANSPLYSSPSPHHQQQHRRLPKAAVTPPASKARRDSTIPPPLPPDDDDDDDDHDDEEEAVGGGAPQVEEMSSVDALDDFIVSHLAARQSIAKGHGSAHSTNKSTTAATSSDSNNSNSTGASASADTQATANTQQTTAASSSSANSTATDTADEYALALYDYAASDKDELSLTTGDIVFVLAKDPSGWWSGEKMALAATTSQDPPPAAPTSVFEADLSLYVGTGQVGHFPGAYVQSNAGGTSGAS